jgi:hypothetical protein
MIKWTSAPGRVDIRGRILTIVLASFTTATLTGSPALVFCFAALSILILIWLENTAV